MKKLKFLFCALTFFFISCEKDKIEGPSLNDLFGELTILEPLVIMGDSANFSDGDNIYFKASFSKQVDWQLRIQGLSSGSIKFISGKSNMINESNSKWGGNSTLLPFFIDEDCIVELTFEGHLDTLINQLNHNFTLKITDTKRVSTLKSLTPKRISSEVKKFPSIICT